MWWNNWIIFRLTVLDVMLKDVRINLWVSHRRKNFELKILLITVRWWFNLQHWISPSWTNLNFGPIGLVGIDLAGDSFIEWKTPSSTLDCLDQGWVPKIDEHDENDAHDENDDAHCDDNNGGVILISAQPLDVLEISDWVVDGDEGVAILESISQTFNCYCSFFATNDEIAIWKNN